MTEIDDGPTHKIDVSDQKLLQAVEMAVALRQLPDFKTKTIRALEIAGLLIALLLGIVANVGCASWQNEPVAAPALEFAACVVAKDDLRDLVTHPDEARRLTKALRKELIDAWAVIGAGEQPTAQQAEAIASTAHLLSLVEDCLGENRDVRRELWL